MSFSAQKLRFFRKNGFLTPCLAPPRKVVLEIFIWWIISYLSMKKNIPAHFLQDFITLSLQTDFRQYILVYNSNIQLLYDTTLLNFLFHFGSFWPEAEPYQPPGGYLGVG